MKAFKQYTIVICLFLYVTLSFSPMFATKVSARTLSSNTPWTAPDLYQACVPSTVQIQSDRSFGSGFFLTDSVVVTNYHVIEDASVLTMTTYDNQTYPLKKILGYDKERDLVLLAAPCKYPALKRNTHGLTIGETVYTIGSPYGFFGTLSHGLLSHNKRVIAGNRYLQTNAPFSLGNSGSPLINAFGELIGVNTMSYAYGDALNFAIDASYVYKIDTKHPISLKKFQKQQATNTTVQEDPNKSHSHSTAQLIQLGDLVNGSSNEISPWSDYYRIDITEPITCLLHFDMDQKDQNKQVKLWIGIQNEANEFVDDIVSVETTFVSSADLTPGIYYIVVYSTERMTDSTSVNYTFTLTKDPGVG